MSQWQLYLPSRMPVVNLIKLFTIVIYNSRVVLTINLPILQFVIYDRKMFLRLATGCLFVHLLALPIFKLKCFFKKMGRLRPLFRLFSVIFKQTSIQFFKK